MENSTVGENIWKGSIAGVIGVTAMDYLVTWPMYKYEDRAAYTREKSLQPEGRWAAHALVSKVAKGLNFTPSEKALFIIGKTQHYLIGMAPAVLYSMFYKDVPAIRKGKGLLYGLSLFILMDEIVVPMLKLSGPTTKYPWQAHLRGLLGHLMMGWATHAAVVSLDKRTEA